MSSLVVRKLPYRLAGVDSLTASLMSVDEWADLMRFPHPRRKGELLTGDHIRNTLGIESKAFEPSAFRDFEKIVGVAKGALKQANVSPEELDQVVIVTCTPYEPFLESDSFALLRALGICDSVIPIQMSAGCAGMARVMNLVASMSASRVLIVTYNISSVFGVAPNGDINPIYMQNTTHPEADKLWASGALFSDGVAATVLVRDEKEKGFAFYSRDSLSFEGGSGFEDPLVRFPGGGVRHPAGEPGSEGLFCFGLSGAKIKEYYPKGMMANHNNLLHASSTYLKDSKRIYTHQANGKLVDQFIEAAQLPKEKVREIASTHGNMVTPCTLKMLDDDVKAGAILPGDSFCISVVGAGPERGAFMMRYGT